MCIILYATKLVQSAEYVFTKKGTCKVLHEMIKTNEDMSCLKQLQKDITSLILVLSEKYSSECFIDSLVDYPSVFHSIDNDSSDSSNEASSSTDDTADSDWNQSVGKSNTTKSVESGSKTLFSTYKKHQITNQIPLVKIVIFKNKTIEMEMIVKNNLERIAQKQTVNMKTACVNEFHQ
jgi:hypothetical protein